VFLPPTHPHPDPWKERLTAEGGQRERELRPPQLTRAGLGGGDRVGEREGNGWEGEGKDGENDNWVSRLGSWDRREI
jgi:hypothetical protein